MTQLKNSAMVDVLRTLGLDIPANIFDAQVVQSGTKVIVPEGSHLPDVAKAIMKQYESEEQVVSTHSKMECPPWDGARALNKAIHETFGTVGTIDADTEIEVEVALGQIEKVKWGTVEIPSLEDARITSGAGYNSDAEQYEFSIIARHKRKHSAAINKLFVLVRHYAETESIHAGKAFTIEFTDSDGEPIYLPTPKFFAISDDKPIFNKALEKSIDRNVLLALRNPAGVEAMGESLKRGVLFAGDYGMGKTMLASHMARNATQYGWTFVYVKKPADLPKALRYAVRRFGKVMVFCEDVDRVGGNDRSDSVNSLLNQLDGIDSKSSKIFTILTTNHPEKINLAMRRPGRIDSLMFVEPPDAHTVGRLIKNFAGTQMREMEDVTLASEKLAGLAPAFIREAVRRAKFEALRRSNKHTELITGADMLEVAVEVVNERQFFSDKHPGKDDTADRKAIAEAFTAVGKLVSPHGKKNGALLSQHAAQA